MTEERIHQLAKALKMPAVLREYPALARRGLADGWTYEEFLSEVRKTDDHERADRLMVNAGIGGS